MKWFIAFLCMLTVFVLFDEVYVDEQTSSDKDTNYDVPKNINPIVAQELLPVEKEWLEEFQEKQDVKKEATEQPQKKKESLLPTLNVGDKNYQLLGIFKQNKQPFILLKAADTELLELKEGDELSPDVVLKKISASYITLLKGEETIEFKLFERSDHGK